ncbi:MAG: glycosyl hydrolase [Planctomycetota bacterium]|nr:glycosyl hydrolase [Planctomycetota bacterium]
MKNMVLGVALLIGTVQAEWSGQTRILQAAESRAFGAKPADASRGENDVVRVGAGGYLRTRPQPCKPLPDVVHKTASLKGPVITGQWWSSLLWQQKKFSQPLFAHPLAAACTESGLTLSYPGGRIYGNAAGIFGSSGGPEGDLKLGHSAAPTFQQADCDGYSDWFVSALFAKGKASLRVSLGHGSPFVYCLYSGGDPAVSFAHTPQVWSGTARDPVLGITAGGHHYGLFGSAGSTWSGLDGTTLINNARGKPYFAVALLPDNRPETLALFRKYAYNHVTDTQVAYRIDAGLARATYRPTIKAYEGQSSGTIFALYPHQWKYATSKLTDMTYGSVRGTMQVAVGESFATAVPIQGVLPMLPPQGVQDKSRMLGYLTAELAKIGRDDFADTYWEGKFLGRLATLSGIAEVTGDTEMQKTFVDEIKRRLENWFTATPGKAQPVFYYNAVWNSLIGSRPSYGSDSSLNDHHFHYGYFIRAAAEVARVDRVWAEKWGPMVNLLIRDIASSDRSDPMFPYLRCFDKYAGHSWASGDANFADGNNQESSSESMNAWYGMILWGQALGDTTIRDTGLFLYNTERTSVEEYWFDVSGTNYPQDYPNVALGMCWGGKGAFGTWFSGDIDCIHGINWLPFTPASVYMGRHPDYVKKNHDRIVEKRQGGSDYNNGWGDLVVMFYALSDPAAAARYIDAHPDCKLEGGNSHAFMYHWIYTLNNLGRNDAAVTADYPLVNVYQKGRTKTYAAYNYQATPLTVKFSDGVTLVAKPKSLTLAPRQQP